MHLLVHLSPRAFVDVSESICICICAVDIKSLATGGVSKDIIDAGRLESSSPLADSLMAAVANGKDIALLLKHLPVKVSSVVGSLHQSTLSWNVQHLAVSL